MENKLIYRINNGSIFMSSSPAAVKAHEEALSRLRRGQPLICRMGRRYVAPQGSLYDMVRYRKRQSSRIADGSEK